MQTDITYYMHYYTYMYHIYTIQIYTYTYTRVIDLIRKFIQLSSENILPHSWLNITSPRPKGAVHAVTNRPEDAARRDQRSVFPAPDSNDDREDVYSITHFALNRISGDEGASRIPSLNPMQNNPYPIYTSAPVSSGEYDFECILKSLPFRSLVPMFFWHLATGPCCGPIKVGLRWCFLVVLNAPVVITLQAASSQRCFLLLQSLGSRLSCAGCWCECVFFLVLRFLQSSGFRRICWSATVRLRERER